MARVKRAVNAHKKRRSVLKASKGYRGQRSRLYRKAKEQQLHSLSYAYRDRRARKGEFRKLWISRINAGARAHNITYNRPIMPPVLTERSARVAAAVKLHRHVGRRRARRFLAEGPNLIEAAAARGLVRDIFATELASQRHAALLARHEAVAL